MESERINEKDLPEGLWDNLWQQIFPYCVGLLAFIRGEHGEQAQLMGSGTLVRVDHTIGILTAQHVVAPRHWKQATHLGLIFMTDVHKPTINMQYLRLIEVAKPLSPSKGPDLGVIILPPTDAAWLKEHRSFWNISLKREEVLSGPLDKDIGVWFLGGFPDEFTRKEVPQRGFSEVKGFGNLSMFCRVEREWENGDYDYLDIPVLYDAKNELPESFGGISGAGLWHIPLVKAQDGTVQAEEPILSGVAFYQIDIVGKKRTTIRCHGRRSVYEAVYNALKNINP